MGSYRTSRNLEASIFDYISQNLKGTWSDINIEKSFSRVYDISLPIIVLRVENTNYNRIELGSNSISREVLILVDIFAESDGQRLDIKDYLVSILKNEFPFYEYYTEANSSGNYVVKRKSTNGRVNVLTISDESINLNTAKNDLDKHDRYRHLIKMKVSLSKLEV